MRSFDRSLCEAIGKNRRAIAKLKKKIQNSMEFNESRGTTDWPRWESLGRDLIDMEKKDDEMTKALKAHRAKKEHTDAQP